MANARPHLQMRQRKRWDLLFRSRSRNRTIRRRNAAEPSEWHCGFYPGRPGRRYGTSPSFEAARTALEAAWREHLPKRSEADFQAWCDHEAWTAEKYRRFDRHERLPSD
jgi:hypothetical protein